MVGEASPSSQAKASAATASPTKPKKGAPPPVPPTKRAPKRTKKKKTTANKKQLAPPTPPKPEPDAAEGEVVAYCFGQGDVFMGCVGGEAKDSKTQGGNFRRVRWADGDGKTEVQLTSAKCRRWCDVLLPGEWCRFDAFLALDVKPVAIAFAEPLRESTFVRAAVGGGGGGGSGGAGAAAAAAAAATTKSRSGGAGSSVASTERVMMPGFECRSFQRAYLSIRPAGMHHTDHYEAVGAAALPPAGSSDKQEEEEGEEEGSEGSDAEAKADNAAGNSEELAAIEADYNWQPADAPELAEGSRIEVFTELEDLQNGGFFTQWLAAHVTKVDLKPRKQKGGSKGKKSKKGKQVLDKWMCLEYDDGLVHSTHLWPMDFNKGRSGLGWRLDRDFYDKDTQGNCVLTAKSKRK